MFIRGRGCGEYLQATAAHLCNVEKDGRTIMKELGQQQVQEGNHGTSLSKQIEMAQNSEKANDTSKSSPSVKISVPQVTITRPFHDPDKSEENTADKNEEQNEDVQKSGGKIAGRRALPEITITCPPVEAFDAQEDSDLINGLFTKRRYMVCRDSPRSGKRTVSLVDFPHGLSALEKSDSIYVESPGNFLDSPYSFSNVDLSFTYNSPLCSPFTPPFTPEMRKSSKFIYPGPVPIFALEQSFPPAEFEDEAKLTD